jgi:hypothetical protein
LFTYTLLSPDCQTDEAWEKKKKKSNAVSEIGEHWIEKYFYFWGGLKGFIRYVDIFNCMGFGCCGFSWSGKSFCALVTAKKKTEVLFRIIGEFLYIRNAYFLVLLLNKGTYDIIASWFSVPTLNYQLNNSSTCYSCFI